MTLVATPSVDKKYATAGNRVATWQLALCLHPLFVMKLDFQERKRRYALYSLRCLIVLTFVETLYPYNNIQKLSCFLHFAPGSIYYVVLRTEILPNTVDVYTSSILLVVRPPWL